MDVEDMIDFLLQDSDVNLSRAYEKSEVRWLQPDSQITFAKSSSKSTYKKSGTYSLSESENWDDLIEDLDNLILTPLRSSNEENGRSSLMKSKCSARKNKEAKHDGYKNRKTRYLEGKVSHDNLRILKDSSKYMMGAVIVETEQDSSAAEARSKEGQPKISGHDLRRKNTQKKLLKRSKTDNGPSNKMNEKSKNANRKERKSRVECIHPEICAGELMPIDSVQTITKYKIHNKTVPSNVASSERNNKLDEKIICKKRTKKKKRKAKGPVNNPNCVVKTQAKIQPSEDDI